MVCAPVCIHKKIYKCNHSKHTRDATQLCASAAAVSHHTNRESDRMIHNVLLNVQAKIVNRACVKISLSLARSRTSPPFELDRSDINMRGNCVAYVSIESTVAHVHCATTS